MITPQNPDLYRPNVGLAVFHHQGSVLLGRRAGAAGPYQWQMPQGGVDQGETPMDAAYRELEEEIGVTAGLVDLLEETSDWLYYDFPTSEYGRGRYQGQRQKWYAFRFRGRDADVKLDLHTPEFSEWRWGPLATAPELVIPFKRVVYEEIARRFAAYAQGA